MPMISEVKTLEELHALYRFVYKIYLKEGYCLPNAEELCIHYPHLDVIPQTTVFIYKENDDIVGTNTLTMNSSFGLHVDKNFIAEVGQVKKECAETNKVLACSWRIVTINDIRIVHALISATIKRAFSLNTDVCLFSFHPKHEKFYQKTLNLKTISEVKEGKAVNNAPAILMRGDRAEVEESKFLKHGG